MKHKIRDMSKNNGESIEVELHPLEAIKRHCYECCGGYPGCVEKMCDDEKCLLYPYRHGTKGDARLTPLKTIRAFCGYDCMNKQPHLVPGCTDPLCALFPYRSGRNPARKGLGNKVGIDRINRAKQAVGREIKL